MLGRVVEHCLGRCRWDRSDDDISGPEYRDAIASKILISLLLFQKKVPFPIIEVDASGNLLYANSAMIQLMQKADIRSSGFSAAFPPHFLSLIRECLDKNV